MNVQRLFVALFLCFFTLFVGGVDWLLLRDYGPQLRTGSFSQVKGQLLKAERTVVRGSKGAIHYGLSCEYQYTVEGQSYRGDRYRFGQIRSQKTQWIDDFLSAHPSGSTVDVSYNAAQPAESVLLSGLQGSDLALMLFLSPFNAAVLGGWFWLLGSSQNGDSLLQRLRAAGISASASWGCLSFPAAFVVGIFLGGYPKLSIMASVWALIVVLSLSAAWSAFRNPGPILKG